MKIQPSQKLKRTIAALCAILTLPIAISPLLRADDEEASERSEREGQRAREREGDERERGSEQSGRREGEREVDPAHRFGMLMRQLHEAMERGNNDAFHHTLRQLAETNEQIQRARRGHEEEARERGHERERAQEREHPERLERHLAEISEELGHLHRAIEELEEQMDELREERDDDDDDDDDDE